LTFTNGPRAQFTEIETMKPAKKKLLVLQAETALIEGLDRIAARKMQSRSELVRQALLAALEKEGLVPLVAA
jgi:hypothetical protein